MQLELDINDLKHFFGLHLAEKYNLKVVKSNFTYDLIDFDENLFGLNCEVMDKQDYDDVLEEIANEEHLTAHIKEST